MCTVKNLAPLDIANCNVFFFESSGSPELWVNLRMPAVRAASSALHPDAARPQEPPQPHVGRQVEIPGARANPNSISA